MLEVTVYLKSGQSIVVKCEACSFQYNSLDLEFSGYEFKGPSNFTKVSIVPSQIAAYTVKE